MKAVNIGLRLALAGLWLLGWAPAAQAGAPQAMIIFEVNSNGDQVDASLADDLCDVNLTSAGSQCTLRAAIQQANHTTGTQRIEFAGPNWILYPATPLPAVAAAGPYGLDGLEIYGKRATIDGWKISPGNNSVGLELNGSRAIIQGFTIQNFSIGIKVNGTLNVIGVNDETGFSEMHRNVLVSNDEVVDPETIYEAGIYITGSSNIVAGNHIGVDVYGQSADPNDYGILVIGNNNRIGTDGDGVEDVAERNIISGNAREGILITGHDLPHAPYSNVIAGNYIGTDEDGVDALPNGANGIQIYETGDYNRIGTNGDGNGDALEGNLISGNHLRGIYIYQTNFVRIAGNRIGLDASGLLPLENHNAGVSLYVAHDCTIGTNGDGSGDALEGNLISGNNTDGIFINTSSRTRISGNWIGLNAVGAAGVPNGTKGLHVAHFSDSVIGTDGDGVSDVLERNVISGNSSDGIYVDCSMGTTQNNRIAGNYVGTNSSGDLAVPNNGNGLFLYYCNLPNTIGGSLPEQRNLFSGNTSNGILLEASSQAVIRGNWIGKGTDSGDYEVGNLLNGIYIRYKLTSGDPSDDNHVLDNLITHNKGDGIQVGNGASDPSAGNRLENNLMYDNDGQGIDLGSAGVEPIDNLDVDSGPNGRQNFPELLGVSYNGIHLEVATTFNSTPNTEFTLWYYRSPTCDANGYGEGRTLVGTHTLTVPASGDTGNLSVNLGWALIQHNDYITAVAVNQANGNSSEFSACRQFTGYAPVVYEMYLPLVTR